MNKVYYFTYFFKFLTELYRFILFSKYTDLSIAMNSIFLIFILFNLNSVISESAVTSGNNRRYICPLACYAYNYGSYHSLPRTDIWCQCPIYVYGLNRQETSLVGYQYEVKHVESFGEFRFFLKKLLYAEKKEGKCIVISSCDDSFISV